MSDDSNNESVREKKQRAGRIGGKATNPNKGFGSNRALAQKAGRIGGSKSKRTKKGKKNE